MLTPTNGNTNHCSVHAVNCDAHIYLIDHSTGTTPVSTPTSAMSLHDHDLDICSHSVSDTIAQIIVVLTTATPTDRAGNDETCTCVGHMGQDHACLTYYILLVFALPTPDLAYDA